MDIYKRFSLILWIFIFISANPGCVAKKTTSMLHVTSQPGDALCTLHSQKEDSVGKSVIVAGVTPVEVPVEFYGNESMWLKVEKRGHQPFIQEIIPNQTLTIPAVLIKNDQTPCNNENINNPITKVIILSPDIELILRGTIKNESPETKANEISEAISKQMGILVGEKFLVKRLDFNLSQEKALKAIWRDSRTAMEITDPIRLNYMMCRPQLETSSARRGVRNIGEQYNADAVLLVSGRVDKELGSLVASKIGLHAIGTAASFASGYNRAMSNHQSTFVYTIYLPGFTNGTCLKAVLVDCRSGDILWVNKGVWGIVEFSDDKVVEKLAADILTNLPLK